MPTSWSSGRNTSLRGVSTDLPGLAGLAGLLNSQILAAQLLSPPVPQLMPHSCAPFKSLTSVLPASPECDGYGGEVRRAQKEWFLLPQKPQQKVAANIATNYAISEGSTLRSSTAPQLMPFHLTIDGQPQANNYSLSSALGALCPAPHCLIPVAIPIPNPTPNPSPPAPEPPVILAVMDMVEARAVFVPEILVDYGGMLGLTIKM
uniref:GG11110 n=1 Tax=Drosophila erecta TaxID=7220 RepID=B3P7M8_DROER